MMPGRNLGAQPTRLAEAGGSGSERFRRPTPDKSSLRSALGTLVVAVLLFGLLTVALPVRAAVTPWRCSIAGCKYDQFQVAYNGSYVGYHKWFGSIASPCGSPPNDGIQWYNQDTALFNDSTGQRIYHSGGSGWMTNSYCYNSTPPPTFWSNLVNITTSYDRSSHMWNWHDHACSGCDWQGYVRIDY